MGLFDDLFGGFFDFNGDGKTTWDEEFIAYNIIEDIENEEEESDDTDDSSLLDYDFALDEDYDSSDELEDKYVWRDFSEDSSEFDVSPEDYETEDEYNEAPNEVESNITSDSLPSLVLPFQITLSVECPALDELDAIKETDYPNKRQYDAAYTLANKFLIYCDKETEQKEKAICHFILEQSSTVIAANYLTVNSGFLYTQAVKDHFSLPVEFPDEDAECKTFFSDMIKKIAQKDIGLSLKVWDWCIEQFMPYAHFEYFADRMLTRCIVDDFYEFPEEFKSELICYLGEHSAFCHAIFRDSPQLPSETPALIYYALQSGSADTSMLIFEDSLINAKKDTDTLIGLISDVIAWCNNGDELESMELFQSELFPLVHKYAGGELEEKIGDWKKEMAQYISETELENEKYAFTRRNSWRKTAPDGKKYGLNVCYYDTEQEYLDAFNEEKYGWRSYIDKEDCFGLNPSDYETQREFNAALKKRRADERKSNISQQCKNPQADTGCKLQENEIAQDISDDKKTYIYCGVIFPQSSRVYHYRTDDDTIKVGDWVIVQVGSDLKETEVEIVSVGQYSRIAVPFPIEKTRFILGKV